MKKIFSTLLIILLFFVIAPAAFAETVVFNTKTLKYHKPGCQWAQKFTVNCIKTEKKDAKAKGGVPCKVCGG